MHVKSKDVKIHICYRRREKSSPKSAITQGAKVASNSEQLNVNLRFQESCSESNYLVSERF